MTILKNWCQTCGLSLVLNAFFLINDIGLAGNGRWRWDRCDAAPDWRRALRGTPLHDTVVDVSMFKESWVAAGCPYWVFVWWAICRQQWSLTCLRSFGLIHFHMKLRHCTCASWLRPLITFWAIIVYFVCWYNYITLLLWVIKSDGYVVYTQNSTIPALNMFWKIVV